MRFDPSASPLDAEIADCLDTLVEIVEDTEIPACDMAFRLAQYLLCATGGECAEVAFDPLAIRLRAVAAQLSRASDEAATDWASRLQTLPGRFKRPSVVG